MTDFPLISKEDNPEVLYQFIKAHFQDTGEIISYASIPDKMGGGDPLKVKGKRSKNVEKDDASAPKPKRAKTVKAEGSTASEYASDEVIQKKRNKKLEVRDAAREAALREEVIQKKRSKGESDYQEALKEATEEVEEEEEEHQKKKGKKPHVLPMMKVTPEMTQRTKEVAADELAKQKELSELYRKQRDDKLKAAGLEESGPLDAKRDAEIASLAADVGKQTVEEATSLLQENLMKGKGTSEVAASESASEAVRSEPPISGNSTDPKAQINMQILSSSPSPSSSSSTDLDDIPLIASEQTQPETIPEQQTTSDLPSTSLTLAIQQPLPNILESEFIDNELLRIGDEVKELILLRKVPILSIHYEDQWMNLKKNASELLDKISQKCLRTQAIVLKRYLAAIHKVQKAKVPFLCLANAPFFSESEYVKIFQKLKQKLLTTQAEAQARENEFQKIKKKIEVLEDIVSKQEEELKRQSEQIKQLMEAMSKQAKP
ncbi:putative uncharacterized protein DDB_G0271982 [Medicago truncatula]|uniref:putative uncharacterized protein DDB_G0271982 n=1 Tax=Medicago truncatula TaxID=3880 RepID=UPI001966E718|nr:putative uncharacterized protein DDB_G0271982 [Medicago truncatula]